MGSSSNSTPDILQSYLSSHFFAVPPPIKLPRLPGLDRPFYNISAKKSVVRRFLATQTSPILRSWSLQITKCVRSGTGSSVPWLAGAVRLCFLGQSVTNDRSGLATRAACLPTTSHPGYLSFSLNPFFSCFSPKTKWKLTFSPKGKPT